MSSPVRDWWPGTEEGIPYRGAYPPNLHQEEYEQLERIGESFTKILDLDEPDDMLLYNQVLNKIMKGRAFIRKELFKETETGWKVFFQWVEIHAELPEHLRSRM